MRSLCSHLSISSSIFVLELALVYTTINWEVESLSNT